MEIFGKYKKLDRSKQLRRKLQILNNNFQSRYRLGCHRWPDVNKSKADTSLAVQEVVGARMVFKFNIKGWGWCSALSKEANMEPLKERSSNFLQPGGPSERNRRKSFSEGGLQPFPRRKSYVVMMRKLQLCLILTIYQGGSWGQPGASWWWRGRRQTEELGWRRRRCRCSPWRRSWLWWWWPTSGRFLSNIHTCSQGPVEESAKKHTSRIRRGSLLTMGSDVDSQPEKEAKKLKEQVEVIQVQSSAQQVPVPDLLTSISFDTRLYPIQFWKSSCSR